MSRSPTNNVSASIDSATILWLLDGNLTDDDHIVSFEAQLGSSERARHLRFLRPQRAREYLLGRMLLRHTARHLLGPPADRIEVAEREHDSPAVSFPAFSSPPVFHFSLSHSRGWIACLASTACAVGLDIENKAHARDLDRLGAAAFDAAEQRWLAAMDAQRRAAGFYRLWNNKEALYKLRNNINRDAIWNSTATPGVGWNCRAIEHSRLHIGVCAAQELTSLDVIELRSL